MIRKPIILLTGGAGYIGSHTYVALTEAQFQPLILDDFSNSNPVVLDRLERITGQAVPCHRGSVLNTELVAELLKVHAIEAVVHFAGFKAVGESVAQPLKYFDNNLGGMISLLKAMENAACHTLVFSSSATVYGDPATVPITEDFPRSHTNPYGHTKLVCEDMIAAVCQANAAWRAGVLRYFNPVGAHPSGLIGEDPNGPPNNLMPYVSQVAVGKRPFLHVFGNDYPTPDGTGVRDYIHVQDLAQAHVAALQALLLGDNGFTVNIGTGQGYSVLDVVSAFEQASGKPVPYQLAPRRPGDVARCYADPALARHLLSWSANHTLLSMCEDTWRWQSNNPEGYRLLE
ncbi:MAG: UDP-glucose 4-epimerase GalE [Rhodoferax sp.]|nr:UDP-glucose 4-epimerase GalE [Rhodoferax sp.]MCF8211577.1 UDP-glucose 4-epimerase GalE [Rhodoferax sp.]